MVGSEPQMVSRRYMVPWEIKASRHKIESREGGVNG